MFVLILGAGLGFVSIWVMRARPVRRSALFVLAILLAFVSMFSMAAALDAAGVRAMEPAAAVCDEHAPSGWFEGTRSEAQFTWLPPRTRCAMVNTRTGETAAWDSGHASVPALVPAAVTGMAAVALVAWAVGATFRVKRD
jgi:hypothetical protein